VLAEDGDDIEDRPDEDAAEDPVLETAKTTLPASRSSTSIEKLKSRMSVGISRFSRPWTVRVRVDC
jgi:hypothetical protein